MVKTTAEKFDTVINMNTFYFFNAPFEEQYEGYLSSIKETLLVLKNNIQIEGLKKELFLNLLSTNENGLVALLALTGFSKESLLRIITLIRVVDDPQLNELSKKENWCDQDDIENISEWSITKVKKKVLENKHFREGLVNLFFEGGTIPFLAKTLPLFELKKLSISKLDFDVDAMVDTLVRYKEKGSYSAKSERNAESAIKQLLSILDIPFETGDLDKLAAFEQAKKRTMDFIIPNKEDPKLIVECSFLVTTSSGQGDKSKTEISVRDLLKEHYPTSRFIGFVDGIGWYVRKNDLERMVTAYDDVFTFHADEMTRFRELLINEVQEYD